MIHSPIRLFRIWPILALCALSFGSHPSEAREAEGKYGNLPASMASRFVDLPQGFRPPGPQGMAVILEFRDQSALQSLGSVPGIAGQKGAVIPPVFMEYLLDEKGKVEELIQAGVVRICPLLPQEKVDAYLLQKAGEGEVLAVVLQTWTKISADERELLFSPLGAQALSSPFESMGLYHYTVDARNLLAMAALPAVRHISAAARDQSLDRESRGAQHGPASWQRIQFPGFGVTVGIGDNASGIHHVDLRDRVVDFVPFPYAHHGVHISGILGGAGLMDIDGEGMAPRARLLNLYFSSVLAQTPELVPKYSMTITNNSYAARQKDCDYAGTYDLHAQAVDHLAQLYPQVLHVFAAGNDGNETCGPYPHGFATVVGGYQPAKNGLVVTSTDKEYHHAWDASMGPVRDGRLKPEITAVGREVYSTIGVDSYFVSGGTSMASPQVAGAAASLTELYRYRYPSRELKSALLKALLMNGARDMGRKGPDFEFGFGFLDLDRSLSMLRQGQFKESVVAWGKTETHTIGVPEGVQQLKVMLYWHDQPSSPRAVKNLIQDLDLEVYDPQGKLHLPLILDPSPSGIWEEARPGRDRVNNVEQVVIDLPEAGEYELRVKGFGLPEGDQEYVLVYDWVPQKLQIHFPTDFDPIKAADSLVIYWSSQGSEEPFVLDFSPDNGAQWMLVDSLIAPEKRSYLWKTPALFTTEGKLRIRQPASQRVSEVGNLVVSSAPRLVLDSIQCPGSAVFRVEPGPFGPEEYSLEYMKSDLPGSAGFTEVNPVNLGDKLWVPNMFSDQYFLFRARIYRGMGYPSNVVKYRADKGGCQSSIWDGNLDLVALDTLPYRRMHSSQDLHSLPDLAVLVQNRSSKPVSNFSLRIDFGAEIGANTTHNYPITLAPMESRWLGFPLNPDLSPGKYIYRMNLDYPGDPYPYNNDLWDTFYYFANDPVSLPLEFHFEDLEESEWRKRVFGLDSEHRWDFLPVQDTGRIRTAILPSMAIEGNRSLSLDAWKAVDSQENALVATLNLSSYRADRDEIRMDFQYLLHGQPKFPEENAVWMRGSDQDSWKKAMVFSPEETGKVMSSGTISLNDVLRGQDFSSSTQIRFVQKDSSLIAESHFGTGLTLDQIRIYEVFDDVHLKSVRSPQPFYCGESAPVPVQVRVYNGVYNDLHNIRLFYQWNDQEPVGETLDFLGAKDSVDFQFHTAVRLQPGENRMRVWANLETDSYPQNDTLADWIVYNQPLIQEYPYREGFETHQGYWYPAGRNSSWEWGEPMSVFLRNAFEGKRVWKTGIRGRYQNDERSYLYSPCFDIHRLTHPYIQFYMIEDIENCEDQYCDAAYLEYRLNGGEWTRLGAYGEGENWYTDSQFHVWNQENRLGWRQVHTMLPKGELLQLRFVMESDPAYTKEGIAIDLVEIMDSADHLDGRVGLYPNPVQGGRFQILWRSQAGDPLRLILHDLEGRSLFGQDLNSEPGLNKAMIQTPAFAPGIYLLTIETGEYREVKKLIYL